MCNTTVLQGRSASHVENVVIMRQEETARSVLGCKRARSTSTTPCDETSRVRRRPHKRVSFSNRDLVLGHAQEYDRSTAPDPVPLATRVRAQLIARRNYLMKTSKAIEGSDSDSPVTSASRGKANFCGIWRRSHGFNWAALLELSGVDKVAIPEQAAKMQASSVVHLIDHDETSFRLIVHSDSGSTQDQHFFIGGQSLPKPNSNTSDGTPNQAGSTTVANMRWAKNGQSLVLTSVDAATGDEMTVTRQLVSGGLVMVQHYRACRAQTGETAEAVTIFRRMVRRKGTGEPDAVTVASCSNTVQ